MGWTIDIARRSRARSGREVELTGTEYELLLMLAREPGRVFSRDDILNQLRGHEADLYTRAVDIVVSRLRKKLEPLDCIKTLRNAGYSLALRREARMSQRKTSAWRRAKHRVAHSIKLRMVLVFLLLAAALTFVFFTGAQKAFTMGWREAARPDPDGLCGPSRARGHGRRRRRPASNAPRPSPSACR